MTVPGWAVLTGPPPRGWDRTRCSGPSDHRTGVRSSLQTPHEWSECVFELADAEQLEAGEIDRAHGCSRDRGHEERVRPGADVAPAQELDHTPSRAAREAAGQDRTSVELEHARAVDAVQLAAHAAYPQEHRDPGGQRVRPSRRDGPPAAGQQLGSSP